MDGIYTQGNITKPLKGRKSCQYSKDEPWGHHAKGERLATQRQGCMISLMRHQAQSQRCRKQDGGYWGRSCYLMGTDFLISSVKRFWRSDLHNKWGCITPLNCTYKNNKDTHTQTFFCVSTPGQLASDSPSSTSASHTGKTGLTCTSLFCF